jgi:hypothetical protein
VILRHPIARVVVDGRRFTSAEAAVGWLEARLSLGGTHDTVRIGLWLRSRTAGIAPGARVSVALGEGNDVVDVWAGKVSHVALGERHVIVEGLSFTASLSNQHLTRTWQEQKVEDIVRDLTGDVDIDEVDASLQLPWYAIDARRTVWSHVRELAAMIGADVAATASGAVRFVPARTAAQSHELRHAAHLIRWRFGELPVATTRGVRAYGAASEAGSQQWHWLLGDSGQSGGGSIPGAIRTRDAADASARARSDHAWRQAHRASVLAVGSPRIRAGDVVRVTDLPDVPQKQYRVIGVLHRLDGATGFTSLLQMEGAAA